MADILDEMFDEMFDDVDEDPDDYDPDLEVRWFRIDRAVNWHCSDLTSLPALRSLCGMSVNADVMWRGDDPALFVACPRCLSLWAAEVS